MEKTDFIFKIGSLVNDDQGSHLNFDINIPNTLNLGDEVIAKSSIPGEVTLMRVEGGINVEIKNIELDLEFKCMKCMDTFLYSIKIPHAERFFNFEEQTGDIDIFDTFYINKKNMTIDISDFLRQEIILHFPSIPVCSKSCKGLCPSCGKNLNKATCSCDKNVIDSNSKKPLSSLKKLYKSANKR